MVAPVGFDVFDIKCCFQTYFNEIVVLDSIAILSPPPPCAEGDGRYSPPALSRQIAPGCAGFLVGTAFLLFQGWRKAQP